MAYGELLVIRTPFLYGKYFNDTRLGAFFLAFICPFSIFRGAGTRG